MTHEASPLKPLSPEELRGVEEQERRDFDDLYGATEAARFLLLVSPSQRVSFLDIVPNPDGDSDTRYSAKLVITQITQEQETKQVASLDVSAGDVRRSLEWMSRRIAEIHPIEGPSILRETGLREVMEESGKTFAAAFLLSHLQLEGLRLSRKPSV